MDQLIDFIILPFKCGITATVLFLGTIFIFTGSHCKPLFFSLGAVCLLLHTVCFPATHSPHNPQQCGHHQTDKGEKDLETTDHEQSKSQ